ncbi:MAG: TetR/AcrR family transcriptional regulator [Chloroflexota bacterium]|nr:MAG: TetR/AcrR family transcriptional regulator [Chloroflexota bacterium]
MPRKLSSEKRQQFLDSALKLFVANGVKNTSTAAIAKDAGTASGTFFLYFPTKQDLINELIMQIGRQQSEYINSLLTRNLSAWETFLTIWYGSIRWFQENMDAYHYFRQVRDSGLIEDEVIQESEQFFTYYYQAIQRGLAEGAIKPYPVELIGGMLYQDIVAVMNLLTAETGPEGQENLIQLGFSIFWDGIKAE